MIQKRIYGRTARQSGKAVTAGFLTLLAGTLLVTTVRAQESGTLPPTPPTTPAPGGQAPTGAPPGGAMPALPPLPVLLGYADFMLIADRPYEAEKIYKLLLMVDPSNALAQQGLKDAKEAQRPSVTMLGHYYVDSEDTSLWAVGGGPILRYPIGRLTITSGTGYYKNNNNPNNKRNPLSLSPDIPTAEDNFRLKKDTYNILFEPFWGKNQQYEGSAFLSQTNYDNAPDRLLYDFKVSFIPEPGRKRLTVGTGRKDSYYSNQLNQFLAPESYFQVKKKITFNDFYFGVEYPLQKKIDFIFNYRYFDYSDGNSRNNFRAQALYRMKPNNPTKPMPIWRVGFDGIVDQGEFFTFDYGIPQDFQSLSIMTDYTMLTRDYKLAVYASVPIAKKNFDPPAGLVLYATKNINKRNEVYFKSILFEAKNLSISLYDYVMGVNTRF